MRRPHADKPGLSVIVLTHNSAATLDACLRSLRFADEILVMDSGSQDRSLAIAKAHGARIKHQPWLGYTQQRNAALALCRHAWVLSVDSDEELGPELAAQIQAMLKTDSPHNGYRIPERVRFFQRWLRHGGVHPGYHLTLFRRQGARYSHGPANVHEGIQIQGSVGRLSGFKLHHAYPDLRSALRKINRYTSLEAQGRWERGQRASLYGIFWRPLERFFKNYVLKAGFLDGWEGFLYCYLTAHYSFVTHIKLYERQVNGTLK